MKKITTIVIIAILVLAAFSLLSTRSVKASTSEATVLSYSRYVAPSNTVLASEPGDLIVVGEVENVGSNIIGNVTIQGTAFSSTETELAQTATQAFVYDTLPGQKAPFYLDFNAASSSTPDLSWVSSVSTVQVTVTSVTDTKDRQYAGVIIPNPGGSAPYIPGNGTYYIDGTILNNGTQVDQHPWVVATFYNSNGTVIGLNFTDELTPSFAPTDALHFFASPTDDTPQLTDEIASYSLLVDSLTLANGTSPQPTPSPTGSTATAQLPILTIAVVVVVIVVVIAVLMLLRRRQKTPLPPPPPPPPAP